MVFATLIFNLFIPENSSKSEDIDEIIQSLMAALQKLQSWESDESLIDCVITVNMPTN